MHSLRRVEHTAVKRKIDEFPPLIHLVPLSFVVLDEVILLEINSVNSMPDVSKLGGENAGSCGLFEGQEAEDVAEQLVWETGDDVSANVVAFGSHVFLRERSRAVKSLEISEWKEYVMRKSVGRSKWFMMVV
ncbi:hypothetical protein QYF36_020164 [Acer negundo]|nr:hypothetical protein QYF36_020164 [Acer negundo]